MQTLVFYHFVSFVLLPSLHPSHDGGPSEDGTVVLQNSSNVPAAGEQMDDHDQYHCESAEGPAVEVTVASIGTCAHLCTAVSCVFAQNQSRHHTMRTNTAALRPPVVERVRVHNNSRNRMFVCTNTHLFSSFSSMGRSSASAVAQTGQLAP
eukprot:GHVS01068630.1.p2 GENE.GHVS01068630.1~~GHVS01068630.1.p2  ORF type:complete len:151 (+),score=24.36 GHVS01068630.1:462-914(+)